MYGNTILLLVLVVALLLLLVDPVVACCLETTKRQGRHIIIGVPTVAQNSLIEKLETADKTNIIYMQRSPVEREREVNLDKNAPTLIIFGERERESTRKTTLLRTWRY